MLSKISCALLLTRLMLFAGATPVLTLEGSDSTSVLIPTANVTSLDANLTAPLVLEGNDTESVINSTIQDVSPNSWPWDDYIEQWYVKFYHATFVAPPGFEGFVVQLRSLTRVVYSPLGGAMTVRLLQQMYCAQICFSAGLTDRRTGAESKTSACMTILDPTSANPRLGPMRRSDGLPSAYSFTWPRTSLSAMEALDKLRDARVSGGILSISMDSTLRGAKEPVQVPGQPPKTGKQFWRIISEDNTKPDGTLISQVFQQPPFHVYRDTGTGNDYPVLANVTTIATS